MDDPATGVAHTPPEDTTLRTEDGRAVLRFRRVFPHPPAKVWRAVTEPAHLAGWFPAEVALTPAVGEKITFTAPGPTPDGDGVITEFDEPRVFAFTWNNEAFRIELIPGGAGCELIFTHTFDDRVAAGSFATGGSVCLAALHAHLAGAPARPGSPVTYAAWHEDFHARFAPLRATAHRDGDHWELRVERLIPFHDGVWATLTEGADPVPGGQVPVRFTNPHVAPGPVTDVTVDGAGRSDGQAADVPEYAETGDGATGERALAYRSGDGEVCWRLTAVPQGTRALITHTIPDADADSEADNDGAARAVALAAWHIHLDLLTARMRGHDTRPWPAGRTEALRRHYTPTVT